MRILSGTVSSRHKLAGLNLKTVEEKILARTGFPSMAIGTLNVTLEGDYIVAPDFTIDSHEYSSGEQLKFQKCRVRGFRMFIMRPDSHERPGSTVANVLELISPIKLRDAWGLRDGEILDVEVEGDESWWRQPEPRNA